MAGFRSDCCGAMTEQIFLEAALLHLWIEAGDEDEKAERPKSFLVVVLLMKEVDGEAIVE